MFYPGEYEFDEEEEEPEDAEDSQWEEESEEEIRLSNIESRLKECQKRIDGLRSDLSQEHKRVTELEKKCDVQEKIIALLRGAVLAKPPETKTLGELLLQASGSPECVKVRKADWGVDQRRYFEVNHIDAEYAWGETGYDGGNSRITCRYPLNEGGFLLYESDRSTEMSYETAKQILRNARDFAVFSDRAETADIGGEEVFASSQQPPSETEETR
ncbi:MAG: hypothetical protein K2O18_16540 [Oscillospiraceae bacterium]|nr:hypothetical protein [Oscillospiraceae bacterium]